MKSKFGKRISNLFDNKLNGLPPKDVIFHRFKFRLRLAWVNVLCFTHM